MRVLGWSMRGARGALFLLLALLVVDCTLQQEGAPEADRVVPLAAEQDAGGGAIIPDIEVNYLQWDAASGSDSGENEDKVFFGLGNNVTAQNTPAFFTALADGDSLHVELGPQGLWMVVLAFRTVGIFQTPVYIIGEIEVGGVRLGKLELAGQALLPGGDDFFYYYNFFLVVTDPTVGGQPAVVSMQVFDERGNGAKESLRVQLTGGTPN